MNDQNNISPFGPGSGGKDKLSEEKLMAYLEGKLSPAEQHDIELWLSEEGMEGDAIEGLKTLKPGETNHSVNRLKHELRKTMTGKKRKRRPLRPDYLTWIAVAVILLLVVAAYFVIRYAKHN